MLWPEVRANVDTLLEFLIALYVVKEFYYDRWKDEEKKQKKTKTTRKTTKGKEGGETVEEVIETSEPMAISESERSHSADKRKGKDTGTEEAKDGKENAR